MKFRLKHHFQIESARFLPNLPENHPCRRTHGHSFKIVISFLTLQDPKIGWGIDYHEIQTKMKMVLDQIDHRLLNEVKGLENPTTENLCIWIYDNSKKIFPELENITIMETSVTECTYPI